MNTNTICIGVETPESDWGIDDSLNELEELATTAGLTIVSKQSQNRIKPNQLSYIGKGKLEEVQEYVEKHDIDLVLFDDDLTGAQQNRIEKELKVKIVDRSSLILDIFARRAKTAQAKAQVELAQLQYFLPRLRGLWTHLERQKGGIGMRGPGEKEIETHRRIIRHKISLLKKKLEKKAQENPAFVQTHPLLKMYHASNRNRLTAFFLVDYHQRLDTISGLI